MNSSEKTLWNKHEISPYGPLKTPSLKPDLLSIAQAHLWQSKRVDPTGLVWLGARYYNPSEGRFLSPDPIRHPACLDLYAYANGDPINNIDPDGRFASPAYSPVFAMNINSQSPFPSVTYFDNFETLFGGEERSRTYDLSDLGRPEMPYGLGVGFINGIKNTFKDARNSAIHISDLIGGYNIHAVYSATINLGWDLEVYDMALRFQDTGRVSLLHKIWDNYFDKHPDGYFLQYSHSRGSVDARNAALMYSEEKRNRIIHIAIAPGGYIYSGTCAEAKHYRVSALRDYIPYNDKLGKIRERHTTYILKSAKNAPNHDHTILSPTYDSTIETECELFIEKRRRKKWITLF